VRALEWQIPVLVNTLWQVFTGVEIQNFLSESSGTIGVIDINIAWPQDVKTNLWVFGNRREDIRGHPTANPKAPNLFAKSL
jgi:hypothetical protein